MKKLLLLSVICLMALTGFSYQNTNETLDETQNGSLPAWLTVGLKLYESGNNAANIHVSAWYTEATALGLPALGDEWFIPEFLGETQDESLIEDIAQAFVHFLSETGRLDELIYLYNEGFGELNAESLRAAEYLRATAWAEFVGADEVKIPDIIFHYNFGEEIEFMRGFYSVPIGVSALAEYNWFFFTPSGWSRENIINYVTAGEESTYFISDLLGYFPSEPIRAVIRGGEFSNRSGGYAFGNDLLVVVHTDLDWPPMIFTHEVVHIILRLHPDIGSGGLPLAPINFEIRTFNEDGSSSIISHQEIYDLGVNLNALTLNDDFFEYLLPLMDELGSIGTAAVSFFEEGLCVVVEHIFLMYVENEWYAYGVSAGIFMHGILDEETGKIHPAENMQTMMDAYINTGGFAELEEFINFQDELMESMIYLVVGAPAEQRATRDEIIANVHARVLQDKSNRDFSDTTLFGARYGILNDYFTAGSFIFYLLEHRGTMYDFMQIYSDFSKAEYVYDATMDELIQDWLAYLDTRFSPELLAFFEWQTDFNTRYADFMIEMIIISLRENAELMGWDDELLEMIIESVIASR